MISILFPSQRVEVAPEQKRKTVKVELHFVDGKLRTVNHILR